METLHISSAAYLSSVSHCGSGVYEQSVYFMGGVVKWGDLLHAYLFGVVAGMFVCTMCHTLL